MIDLRDTLDRLASKDEAERIYAAEDIGYANEPEGIEPLLERLPVEKSRAVREAIFSALTQMESDRAVQGVLAVLDSDDAFLRNGAVEMLQSRTTAIGLHLFDAFQNGGPDRRKLILDILARKADAQSEAIYEAALQDPDLNVVITAVENIGNKRMTEFRDRVTAMVSPDAHPMLTGVCLEALAAIGNEASVRTTATVLGGIATVAPYLRASYIRMLGATGGPEYAAEIAEAAGAGLESAALNALNALRRRYPNLRLPATFAVQLQDIIRQSPSSALACQAVRLLGGFVHEPGVVDTLDRCLLHTDKAVRIAAVQVLSESGRERGQQALQKCLATETDEEVLQAWCGGPKR